MVRERCVSASCRGRESRLSGWLIYSIFRITFPPSFLRSGAASNFDGADFTNAIVDRANFQGSSLRGTIFTNAVLTGTSFNDADLEGADFSEAAIGEYDVRSMCKNPTLKGENPTTGMNTRLSVGCKS